MKSPPSWIILRVIARCQTALSRIFVPFLLALLLLITSALVFEGPLRRQFPHRAARMSWEIDGMSIEIFRSRESRYFPEMRYSPMHITVPFSQTPRGCEFVYGAVVYRYHQQSDRLIEQPRYLTKFRYNLERGRCESKDLFIIDGETPFDMDVQLVDVELSGEEIIEMPRPEGLRIIALSPEEVRVAKQVIPAQEPFRRPQFTKRISKFSANLDAGEAEMLVAPYDQVKPLILSEIRALIERCKSSGQSNAQCSSAPGSSIRGAIAEILDPDISDAMEDARAAGIDVDVLTNYRAQAETSQLVTLDHGKLRGVTARFDGPSPWMWLRLNPHSLVLKLPMHTKFIIIGDSFVLSTNANFNFMFTESSREVTMVYRSPTVVQMFDDLLAQIRTSVYRPLDVDLRDNFLLLFNADRPRGYSVTDQKSYVPINTNEGVRSSAYGILLELLARSTGEVVLAMSPISDACDTYRRRHCLFDILSRRAGIGMFRLFMNGYFYFSEEVGGLDEWRYAARRYQEEFQNRFRAVRKIFSETSEDGLSIFMQKGNSYSLHHERLGLVGDDWVLAGSANLGQKGTLNVMELLRSPVLMEKVKSEVATFDEPYFVSHAHEWTPEEKEYRNCEFTFERELLHWREYKLKRFQRSEVISELKRKYGVEAPGTLFLVSPAFDPRPDDGVRYFKDVGEKVVELEEVFTSLSSYLCIQDSAGQSYVVNVQASAGD